ncbi:MAG: AMP-binding protein, partial [Gammaproteobacteria bacterium]|nr:AMP-binding protein [Gammaproteobacteria bacterium]NNJ72454.1 AMP-binding protein [Enterobacterales bacterium]
LDSLASLIYTSGTTGMPKGVMVTYRGMAEAGAILMDWIEIEHDDRFFSYLPLAHTAERTAIGMSSIYCGCEVSFVGSLETFSQDLARARPTVFFGVPRIWLKFQQAVESKLPGWALNTILKIPGIGAKFAKSLRQKLGLDEVKIAVSGAASLPLETMRWFDAIGIPVCEAYGMTESLGCATFNHPAQRQLGSVGRPVPGTIVKITDDNEIIYTNNCLMDGYYREPELTSQTIKDGYLYTGDTGYVDEEGFVWITGRIKDIFKTEKGKYIAPVPIEAELEPRAGLEQICVLGSNLTQPVALSPITVKPEGAELQALESKLLRIMDEVNQHLSANERLACWFMVEATWSTDNGMITPTLKLRRQAIETAYMPQIMAHNEARGQVIWLKVPDIQ